MAKCTITKNQLFNEIVAVKKAGGNVDILAAHMQGLKNKDGLPLYPVADTGDVTKFWKDKYTSFRNDLSANEKKYRKGVKDSNGKWVTPPNIALADTLKEGFTLTKLGARVKVKADEVWADIGNLVAEYTKANAKPETPVPAASGTGSNE